MYSVPPTPPPLPILVNPGPCCNPLVCTLQACSLFHTQTGQSGVVSFLQAHSALTSDLSPLFLLVHQTHQGLTRKTCSLCPPQSPYPLKPIGCYLDAATACAFKFCPVNHPCAPAPPPVERHQRSASTLSFVLDLADHLSRHPHPPPLPQTHYRNPLQLIRSGASPAANLLYPHLLIW